jgi:hypothetical protein
VKSGKKDHYKNVPASAKRCVLFFMAVALKTLG